MDPNQDVFNEEDIQFFWENGYIVLPEAVPPENLQATIDAIWEFLGMDPNDPEDWYRPPHRVGGMVEMYQHQALWNNRQSPRIYAAFRQLLGTHKLWVSMDRANMKPPSHPDHPEYDHKGFIHWDADTSQLPLPFRLQGVLYLTDTDETMGGFQCIPGLHKLLTRCPGDPEDKEFRLPDLREYSPTPIPGKAGDFVIWHVALPHGNGHNVSDRPRLAQYITMYPAAEENEEARKRRIHLWKNRLCPGGRAFPGDPRRVEELHGTTAVLSPLGRKLLGLDRWEESPPVAG